MAWVKPPPKKWKQQKQAETIEFPTPTIAIDILRWQAWDEKLLFPQQENFYDEDSWEEDGSWDRGSLEIEEELK